MTLRIERGEIKSLDASEGDLRLQRGEAKALSDASGSLRLQRGEIKILVQPFIIRRILNIVPPSLTTQARAPYIRS